MLDGRSKFQREVGEIVQESFAQYTKILNTSIPLSIEVSKQQSQGLPIVALKNNKVSEAYNDFAKEVLNNG